MFRTEALMPIMLSMVLDWSPKLLAWLQGANQECRAGWVVMVRLDEEEEEGAYTEQEEEKEEEEAEEGDDVVVEHCPQQTQ